MQKYYFYILVADDNIEDIRYVGVTTQELKQRFAGHLYSARHPKDRTTPVSKWIWSKISNDITVRYYLIDWCYEDQWEQLETAWIQHYRDLGFKLLNIQKGGSGVITKEMREKSGILRSIEAHEKPIYALNANGEIVKEYKSVVEATRDLNIKAHSAISNALNGRAKTSGGYYWVSKEEYDKKGFNIPRCTYVESLSSKVYKYDLKGNFIKSYESKNICCNLEGFSLGGLNSAIAKKLIFHEAIWSDCEIIIENPDIYFRNSNTWVEIDNNDNIIRYYKSIREIADYYNEYESTIVSRVRSGLNINGNKIIKIVK